MKYVIAGNTCEAKQWIDQDMQRRMYLGEPVFTNEYYILHNAECLRGQHNPSGIFVGSWKKRKDLFDIHNMLLVRMSHDNPSHKVIQTLLVDYLINENQYEELVSVLDKEMI